ncbi:diaminopimelate epimerase [Curvivirga sp.]|uniref:diaminopimelate epimerase n=1 Tax=Curvivirga sp. TaxID=2856848 RepID=UPI003B59BD04
MVAFRKMHGLGNDFIVVDNRDGKLKLSDEQIKLMSHRRLGIGCDQFIILEPAQNSDADVFMRIHNPDASESGACGNATRCVASLIIAETGQSEIIIETLRGLLPSKEVGDGLYSVNMGGALLDWQNIPLSRDIDTTKLPIEVDGAATPFAVGMGNPHCVFFVDDADKINLEKVGPEAEHHPLFPERTNVEFVSKKSDGSLRMRVWERSAGITMACGSGACAVGVAAFESGFTDNRKMDIELDGGVLTIEYLENGDVIMTGPVATSFISDFDLDEAA